MYKYPLTFEHPGNGVDAVEITMEEKKNALCIIIKWKGRARVCE